MLRKSKVLWNTIILCVVCVMVMLFVMHSKKHGLSLVEREFTPNVEVEKIDLDGEAVIGAFQALNTEERGIYLSNNTQDGYLQINYCSLTEPTQKPELVYQSEYISVAHSVYALDNNILLLELYYTESSEMAFCLNRIGYADQHNHVQLLYQENCEKMPYVNVVDLTASADAKETQARILLNYDNKGVSQLVLLNSNYGAGNEHTIINCGAYGRYGDGSIESGRRIVFGGGYGDYVYYQVIYNTLSDPMPEIATFEASGNPVLFRYNIHTEEITQVMKLDKIALHMNASEKYSVISEYDYDKPLMQSGKLIALSGKQNDYCIPGVESGVDISSSRFVDIDLLVFNTPQKLYFADFDSGIIYTCELNDKTMVWLTREGVYLAESSDEQAEIQYIVYSEVFNSD